MLYTDAALYRIRTYVKDRGLSAVQVAGLSGLAHGTVRKLRRRTFNPTLDTLRSLERIVPPDFMPLYWHATAGEPVPEAQPEAGAAAAA